MSDVDQLRSAGLLSMAADVSELIEALPEDAELGVFAVVYEVNFEDADSTLICYRSSDTRRWIQEGLFRAAVRAVDAPPSDDDGDDE